MGIAIFCLSFITLPSAILSERKGEKSMTIVQEGVMSRLPTGEKELGSIVHQLNYYAFNEEIFAAYTLAGENIALLSLIKDIPNLARYTYFYRGIVRSTDRKGRITKLVLQGKGTDFFVINCLRMTELTPAKGHEVIIGYNDTRSAFVAYQAPCFTNNYILCEIKDCQSKLDKFLKGGKKSKLSAKYTQEFNQPHLKYQVIAPGGFMHINHRSFTLLNKSYSAALEGKVLGTDFDTKVLTHLLPYVFTILVYYKETEELRLYYYT